MLRFFLKHSAVLMANGVDSHTPRLKQSRSQRACRGPLPNALMVSKCVVDCAAIAYAPLSLFRLTPWLRASTSARVMLRLLMMSSIVSLFRTGYVR